MAKFADRMEKIAEGVTEGYQKIEDGVVTGYKKIEGGIVVGIVGMVLVGLAYPVYNRVLKTERQRIAPEILRLTDELMR